MRAIAVYDEIYMLEILQEAVSTSSDVEHVEAFSTCSAALAYAAENPVDTAFLDINMRGIGGLGLAEKLMVLHPRCKITYRFTGQSLSIDEQIWTSEEPHDMADFVPYYYI